MSDISRGSLSESPAKLDEETERLINAFYEAARRSWGKTAGYHEFLNAADIAANTLRSRIRELVEEARIKGQDEILDPDGYGRAHLKARI